MVELTKFQIAAIKRTNTSVKPIKKKLEKIEEKLKSTTFVYEQKLKDFIEKLKEQEEKTLNSLLEEAKNLKQEYDTLEEYTKHLTGGYTSDEYLTYLETGVLPKKEVDTASIVAGPDYKPTASPEPVSYDDNLPFGNPSAPNDFYNNN